MKQKTEKDPLSFTFIVGTAHNPHPNMTRHHTHHHQDHLPPSTTPRPYSPTSLHRCTTLIQPYNNPAPKTSEHPSPRSGTIAQIRRYTSQTTSTCATTRLTTGRHNYPANASKSDKIIDPAPDFEHNTEPTLQQITTTPEISDHHLHFPHHHEPAPEPTHSLRATTPSTASPMIIRPDLSTEQNQVIWENYHAIQKQIADMQSTIQSALDILQRDRMTQTLPDTTNPSDSLTDQLHPINRDPQSLADTSKVSQIPIILLFDITNTFSLLPRDPISYSMTAHHNCKRSSSQPPSFDFP